MQHATRSLRLRAQTLLNDFYVFLVGTLLGSLITFLTERVTPLLYVPIEEEGE